MLRSGSKKFIERLSFNAWMTSTVIPLCKMVSGRIISRNWKEFKLSRASFAPQQSLISQMVYGFEILKWRKRRKACFQQIEKAHEILYKSAHPALEAASRGRLRDRQGYVRPCRGGEPQAHSVGGKVPCHMQRPGTLEASTSLRALPATAPHPPPNRKSHKPFLPARDTMLQKLHGRGSNEGDRKASYAEDLGLIRVNEPFGFIPAGGSGRRISS